MSLWNTPNISSPDGKYLYWATYPVVPIIKSIQEAGFTLSFKGNRRLVFIITHFGYKNVLPRGTIKQFKLAASRSGYNNIALIPLFGYRSDSINGLVRAKHRLGGKENAILGQVAADKTCDICPHWSLGFAAPGGGFADQYKQRVKLTCTVLSQGEHDLYRINKDTDNIMLQPLGRLEEYDKD